MRIEETQSIANNQIKSIFRNLSIES